MMNKEMKDIANAKWDAFYRSATASGVWFLAFAASLSLAKWSDGATLTVLMLVTSLAFAVVTFLLMGGAMMEAQAANRAASKADAEQQVAVGQQAQE